MRVLALILLAIAAVAAAPPTESRDADRIVGGSVTTINVYPFGTPLLFSQNLNNFRQACGGTIINNRSVLSAAHCFYRRTAQMWRIRVGSTWANSGGTVHNTNRIINHPNYNNANTDNDIAVLRSNTNIGFINNAVQPGRIAGANYNLGDNQVVWAIGWGAMWAGGPPSEQLRHVQIWTINQNVCAQRYNQLRRPITANMLCSGWLDVGGRDQCQGDSGGPLLHNGIVVGVSSFGYGCANPRFPGVNARVTRFSNWIVSNA